MSQGRKRSHVSKEVKRINVKKGSMELSIDKARRMCTGKTAFYSRKTVKNAAKAKGLRYYKCDFCGKWHLTSSKGGKNPWTH